MKINTDKLKKIIKNFTDKKILIIGDLMLDEYIFGKTTRLSPEAPIPIVEVEKINYVLGGAANTANNVKSLGAQTILTGLVGKDENGQILIKLLKKRNIKVNGILEDIKRPTTLKSRVVSQGQQIVRIDKENRKPIAKKIERALLTYIKKTITKVDVVLISDYAKGVVTSWLCQQIISLAKINNKPVLIDPKGKNSSKYKDCFIIAPNLNELEDALKIQVNDLSKLPQAAKMLLAHVNSEAVLVTLGGFGMALLEKSGKYFTVPATNVGVVDISGAGDTAISNFALSLAAGATFREAMLISTYACSVVIGKRGTATASQEEIINAIKKVKFKKDE